MVSAIRMYDRIVIAQNRLNELRHKDGLDISIVFTAGGMQISKFEAGQKCERTVAIADLLSDAKDWLNIALNDVAAHKIEHHPGIVNE